jgi:predicted alpha/beta hydrolase
MSAATATANTTAHPAGVSVTIKADDGYALTAALYGGAGAGPVTVIAPATGVPQRYYARFAQYLASAGRPVLTLDYRGQGKSAPASLRGFKARFRDWGILDLPGVIDWAAATYPDRKLHWVGHSYGGFGLGLARNNARVDRLLGISSMAAWLGHLPLGQRMKTVPAFRVAAQAANLIGYLPAGIIGTEPLPKEVMREWVRFCTTKGFLFALDDLPEKRHFASLTAAVRLAFAEDDTWMARAGVEHLLREFAHARDGSIWQISRSEAAGRAVGHVGFFRTDHRHTLWPTALAWLDGASTERSST